MRRAKGRLCLPGEGGDGGGLRRGQDRGHDGAGGDLPLSGDGPAFAIHLAAHQRLPQPRDGRDHCDIARAADRIGGKGHPGGAGGHHGLHDDGGKARRLHPSLRPVARDMSGPARGTHRRGGGGDPVAGDVQHGGELPRMAGLCPILAARGGTNGIGAGAKRFQRVLQRPRRIGAQRGAIRPKGGIGQNHEGRHVEARRDKARQRGGLAADVIGIARLIRPQKPAHGMAPRKRSGTKPAPA